MRTQFGMAKFGVVKFWYQMLNTMEKCGTNSIAFGSAPRREADSQPVSQLVRQAVSHAVSPTSRQAGGQTAHTGWAFSVTDSATSSGEPNTWKISQWSNGNAVNQQQSDRGSIPGRPTAGRANQTG